VRLLEIVFLDQLLDQQNFLVSGAGLALP